MIVGFTRTGKANVLHRHGLSAVHSENTTMKTFNALNANERCYAA